MLPPTLPRIAVVGAAGALGSKLLLRLAQAGYHCLAFDINGADLERAVAKLNNVVVTETALEAALASDIVILAVGYTVELSIAESFADQLGDRIVVSVTNPLTAELNDVVTPPDESAAEHLALVMPHARIVKAFNSLSVAAFEAPFTQQPQFDTFVASDDRAAAHAIEAVITSIGFRPWYVGGLIHSRTLERMSALLIGISLRYGLQGAVGWRVEN